MKRITLAMLLASGLMAFEDQSYIGLSAGEAKISGSGSGFGASINDDKTENAFNLAVGSYLNENGRISATYTYIDSGNGVDMSDAITASYDFVLPLGERFSLYIGPNIGYTRFEYDNGLDLSGMHYGGQAGAIVNIMPNLEIEAGYRYLIETGSETRSGIKIELDDIKIWHIGANFRF